MRAMTVVRADWSWDREGILETFGATTSANGGSWRVGVDEREGVGSGGRGKEGGGRERQELKIICTVYIHIRMYVHNYVHVRRNFH